MPLDGHLCVLDRFSSPDLQSDDQNVGHIGGLLSLEGLWLLPIGRTDTPWGQNCEGTLILHVGNTLLAVQSLFKKINYFSSPEIHQWIQHAKQQEIHFHVEYKIGGSRNQFGHGRHCDYLRLGLEPPSGSTGYGTWGNDLLNKKHPYNIQL